MGRCTKDKTPCNPHCPYFSNNTKTPIEYRLDRNGVKRGTNIKLYCYYDDHIIQTTKTNCFKQVGIYKYDTRAGIENPSRFLHVPSDSSYPSHLF